MEQHSIGNKSASFKEAAAALAPPPPPESIGNGEKRRRSSSSGCFSFMEISIDPGVKSLKHLDSDKLKEGIKKWAKAVVTYARQVSQRFAGSSRKSTTDE